MSRRLLIFAAFLAVLGMVLISIPAIAGQGDTERVSVSSTGAQGGVNSWSCAASISADGRYVAFWSDASTLVTGDTNGRYDVFVRDRVLNVTERVSVSSTGVQGDKASWEPSISADGRYVAFSSMATNLVTGDTNDYDDVFVHDRVTGATERVSISSTGLQGNNYSGTVGADGSHRGIISADGRYVVFASFASNLVISDTNGSNDIFVHDRVTHETKRVSVSSTGVQGSGDSYDPSISADGRYVAFDSYADNLVPGDTPYGYGYKDVFVYDRVTGATERVSVSYTGTEAIGDSSFPSVSADGRYVAFDSYAENLVDSDTNSYQDVFVYDRVTGTTEYVSVSSADVQGSGVSFHSSISADGRYVAFDSYASNLVLGDTNNDDDVFVHDRVTGETVRVSVSSSGAQGSGWSERPSISADGRYVAFKSTASNLVLGDTAGIWDVFVHQYLPDAVEVSAPSGWLNPGWNYFSIPLDPTGTTEASELLGFACKNILYQWDPIRKNFELYPDDFTDLARGRGYILRLSTDQQPSYDAFPSEGDFEIAIPEAGRIQIGQPFNHATLLANCLIRNNATGDTRTASDDKAAGSDAWINWNLVWWDSTYDTWKLLSMSGGDDTYLRPWHGYIVWANVRDLTLIVPSE